MNPNFVNLLPEIEAEWKSMNLVQEAIETHNGFDPDTPELVIFTHLVLRFVLEKGWDASTFIKMFRYSKKYFSLILSNELLAEFENTQRS
jgi:hypothetical protein